MRKFWILFLMLTASMDAVAKLNVTQIVTTEYVQSYLRQYADMPELGLANVGSDKIATQKYVSGAIDFINGGDADYASDGRSGVIATMSYLEHEAVAKVELCRVPWGGISYAVSEINYDIQWFESNNDISWDTVAYSDVLDIFVALGSRYDSTIEESIGYAAVSQDGIEWNVSELPELVTSGAVSWGHGKFVIVGYQYDGSTGRTLGRALVSEDGINWTPSNNFPDGRWVSVVYGKGLFVATQEWLDGVAYSTDGITWTVKSVEGLSGAEGLTYGNDTFVAVNGENKYYSSNGVDWTKLDDTVYDNFGAVAFGNKTFVTVGHGGTYGCNSMYSVDNGKSWTNVRLPRCAYWNSVTYGDGVFVAVAQNTSECPNGMCFADSDIAAYSTNDGKSWGIINMPVAKWQSVTYGNSKFVAVGKAKILVGTGIVLLDSNPWTVYGYYDSWNNSYTSPLVGGVASCENTTCYCTRQKLIKDGEYVDNVAQTPVEINRTFADQNACNMQCADACADNAVNNTDGVQKDILCGK